ncbi:MAG: polyprenol monophosphomannose synthase [Kiritimatiellae bacterium]|jgi:dolichol-phosphate mannosyltransferase|nr:polyprenol monophosphomannose synthase [Kiritimatiellia bacterium]
MEKTLVVIPTYDERENVKNIASAVLESLPEANMLFVDDNSPDGTGDVLDEMHEADQRINVLHKPGKSGLGRAYVSGFKWAIEQGYDYIFEMDADFSHDPAVLPKFLEEIKNYDLVVGSRYIDGIRIMNWPLNRLMLSKGASVYVKVITGMPLFDPTGGYKCFRRELLEKIDLDNITSNGYSFQIEMNHFTWMHNYKIKEVPIVFEDRRSGYSKMNKTIVREAILKVWQLLFKYNLRRKPLIIK